MRTLSLRLLVAVGVSVAAAFTLSSVPGRNPPTYQLIGGVAHANEGAAAPPNAEEIPSAELAEKTYVILEKTCLSCHSSDKRLSRKLLVDRKGYKTLVETQKKVIPGKPDSSALYTSMLDKDEPMPPADHEPRPSAADIALIRTWIERGAPAWSEVAPSQAEPVKAAPAPAAAPQ